MFHTKSDTNIGGSRQGLTLGVKTLLVGVFVLVAGITMCGCGYAMSGTETQTRTLRIENNGMTPFVAWIDQNRLGSVYPGQEECFVVPRNVYRGRLRLKKAGEWYVSADDVDWKAFRAWKISLPGIITHISLSALFEDRNGMCKRGQWRYV